MFLGVHQHTLDPKGRVILPAALRDELQEGMVLTVGHDRCVTVHPMAAWNEMVRGLRSLRATDRRERDFTRMMTSSAHPQTLDKQGRITVPQHLRRYAGLDRDVTVVGNDEHLELWDAGRWDAYYERVVEQFANTDEPFDVGGF